MKILTSWGETLEYPEPPTIETRLDNIEQKLDLLGQLLTQGISDDLARDLDEGIENVF